MRIILRISSNTTLVPFDYQAKLVGCVHKWIGPDNDQHGNISLYSFSWLYDSIVRRGSLDFPNGARMFISFYDSGILKAVIDSIQSSPAMFCGMEVRSIDMTDYPDFTRRDYFYCASPVFIKRRLDSGETRQYNFNDADAGKYMRESLLTKMRQAGLEDDNTLDIRFDTSYAKKKLKLVNYHGVGNKASICPIIIHGKPSIKRFAWDVGIGSCTGIGFGAIY
jgi:CRISPR-associated endoribonuclease Cas6